MFQYLFQVVNDEQAELLEVQKKNRNWKGWVAPLPNCTTTGLAITLKPLLDKYGAKKVLDDFNASNIWWWKDWCICDGNY